MKTIDLRQLAAIAKADEAREAAAEERRLAARAGRMAKRPSEKLKRWGKWTPEKKGKA